MTAAMISLADRERLLAGQHLILATDGHRTESLCYAQIGFPFTGAADRPCQQAATHRIQRYDYAVGVTTPAGFAPEVVRSRVCAEHALIVQDEPGLLDITEIRGAR